jgi:hypothetical protein
MLNADVIMFFRLVRMHRMTRIGCSRIKLQDLESESTSIEVVGRLHSLLEGMYYIIFADSASFSATRGGNETPTLISVTAFLFASK